MVAALGLHSKLTVNFPFVMFDFLLLEIGLKTLADSHRDVFYIIVLRMIRLVSFGATALIFAIYLKTVGIDERYIGMFMTLTFVGDLILSFYLALIADKVGRRMVIFLSSLLIIITGVTFALTENIYILATVAFFGVLTPSGGEVGVFRSIEQSAIALLSPPHQRSDVYTWYNFSGAFCQALGTQFSGWVVDWFQDKYDFTLVEAYKSVWVGYAIVGVIMAVISICMSPQVESEVSRQVTPDLDADEQTPLVAPVTESAHRSRVSTLWHKFMPELHQRVLGIVIKLLLLFALDAFASSLIPLLWISYFIKHKFGIPPSYLGLVFFTTGVVAAFTSLLSTSFTKRFGPVLTMVGTHLPSSILLGLVPFPSSFKVTLAILILRALTQLMDVAPKHVFLATIVPDNDRTAVFAFINVVKTLAHIPGPMVVGFLTKLGAQWITFCVASLLKVTYDLGILATFLGVDSN